MKLRFLGGAREIGRSAILVDDRILLDYGMGGGGGAVRPLDVDPEAVVVSHGHLDHVGLVPALLKGDRRPSIHWTPPTRDLAYLLAQDTLKLREGQYDQPFTRAEVGAMGEVSQTHGYDEPFEAAGYEVTFYDAGHIPGSAHVLVDDGETRLLYSGDFHGEDQRLLSATSSRPDADVVVTESTYSDVTRDARSREEARFVETVEETIVGGGTVVAPAFAIGRTQEVAMICAAHDIPCYVDGMGTAVTERFRQHPAFLRDHDAFRSAVGHARVVTGRDGQRKRIAEENVVVITTAGMLNGGPAMTYVPAIKGNPQNLVAFTGHQVEGTPGHDLLETGSAELDGRHVQVAARREAFDFSAHADRDGLLDFLDDYRDSRVLVNHGDRCAAFAEELRGDGYDATAPEIGETVSV